MHAGPPPKKKGCSTGCWVAIAIVGGLVLILGGIGAYVAYQVSQDPDVKKALAVIGDGLEIYNDAKDADGVEEIAEKGCTEPLIFNIKKLLDFAEEHSDEDFDRPKLKVTRLIVCNTKKKKLTCEDLAEEYVDAASPKKGFAVVINQGGESKCSETFDEDGESQGEFASSSVPIPSAPDPDSGDSDSSSDDD